MDTGIPAQDPLYLDAAAEGDGAPQAQPDVEGLVSVTATKEYP